ncbi:MAG: hypothetical protein SGPRY_009209, partial [Prymnesium sp.]
MYEVSRLLADVEFLENEHAQAHIQIEMLCTELSESEAIHQTELAKAHEIEFDLRAELATARMAAHRLCALWHRSTVERKSLHKEIEALDADMCAYNAWFSTKLKTGFQLTESRLRESQHTRTAEMRAMRNELAALEGECCQIENSHVDMLRSTILQRKPSILERKPSTQSCEHSAAAMQAQAAASQSPHVPAFDGVARRTHETASSMARASSTSISISSDSAEPKSEASTHSRAAL